MTLLELKAAIAGISPVTAEDTKLRDMFIAKLEAWVADESTVERLVDDLNRLLGHVWFSSSEVHQRVFEALDAFAREVRGIGGMTVNERLFTFGLLAAWGSASEGRKKLIRLKIGAA